MYMSETTELKNDSNVSVEARIKRAREALASLEEIVYLVPLPAREATALKTRAGKLSLSLDEIERRSRPKPTKATLLNRLKGASPEKIARALAALDEEQETPERDEEQEMNDDEETV